jgi:hypothetical protein
MREDGAVVKQARPSALGLFGSLKSLKKFPGRAAERETVVQAVGRHAVK